MLRALEGAGVQTIALRLFVLEHRKEWAATGQLSRQRPALARRWARAALVGGASMP